MNSVTVNPVTPNPVTVDLVTLKKKLASCKDEIIRYLVLLKNAADQLAKYVDEHKLDKISEVTYKAKVNQLADLLCTSNPTINLSENVVINSEECITSEMMNLEMTYDDYIYDIYRLCEVCYDVAYELLECECAHVDIYTPFVLSATHTLLYSLRNYTKKYDFVPNHLTK